MGKSDVRRGWFETVICSARRGQDARLRRALEHGPLSSAGKRGVLHLGCRARMTVNRCFWSKHGTRTKLHGGGSPNKWRKRWVSKTHSSISCPARRLLEPRRSNDDFPRPLTTHKVDYARITSPWTMRTPAIQPWLAVPRFSGHSCATSQEYRVSDAKEGLKHQTSSFLLRTSLNVAPDQEA